jgi:hypothetical protein
VYPGVDSDGSCSRAAGDTSALAVDHGIACTGQKPGPSLPGTLTAGRHAHLLGAAGVATELDTDPVIQVVAAVAQPKH